MLSCCFGLQGKQKIVRVVWLRPQMGLIEGFSLVMSNMDGNGRVTQFAQSQVLTAVSKLQIRASVLDVACATTFIFCTNLDATCATFTSVA